MKIMFFTLSLQNGGAERVIASLSNEMAKKHDVIIATVHNSPDHYRLDETIKRDFLDKTQQIEKSRLVRKIEKLSPKRISRLINIIEKESPEVIITFLPLPSFYIMAAKRFSKVVKDIPVILSERADPGKEYQNKVIFGAMKEFFKNADGFVFQTEDARKFYDGIVKRETKIIENPINESFLSHRMPKNRRKIVVSCGRLEAQKNFKLLMRAFKGLVEKYPEYELEIYGEGSQKHELARFAKELDIDSKAHLKGRVENVADKIADAELFILSSNYEGMPNALMEAMALGIPCIATDCPVGGPRALIKNGKNGVLINVGDEKQLVEAMTKIVSDKVFASRLSKNSREWSKGYTVEKVADKWEKYIEKVLGKR